MQAFSDLVGADVVTAHPFGELTDLTPSLDTVTTVRDTTAQASEARGTTFFTTCACSACLVVGAPALDTATAAHDMAAQASAAGTMVCTTPPLCHF